MLPDTLGGRRLVAGFLILLSLAAALTLGVIPSRSGRSLLRDDFEVTMTWAQPGANAESLERRVLVPMDDLLARLGAQRRVGSASAGRVRLTAVLPGNQDVSAMRSQLERAAAAQGGTVTLPSIGITRATADDTLDLMRVLVALALALAMPAWLASLSRSDVGHGEGGRPSAFRRCVWRRVDFVVDRFQDALAVLLRHRRRLTPVVLAVVAAGGVAAASRGSAAPPRDAPAAGTHVVGAPLPGTPVRGTPVRGTNVWHIQIYGEDLQTLAGVAMRTAAEVRRLPTVVHANVVSAPGEILLLGGVRAARIDVTVSNGGAALGEALYATAAATLTASGHRFTVDGPADTRGATLTMGTVAAAGTFALLLALALRHDNWVAPAAIAAGIPVVLAGAALGGVLSSGSADRWWWLGAALPLLMLARHGSALLGRAEREQRPAVQLHVALIDAARAALRPLLLVTAGQFLVLVPFAMLGGARVAAAAWGAIGGLIATMGTVTVVAPVAYESISMLRAHARAAQLARQLRRRAGT